MRISLIFAMDENNGIGKSNQLPWHLPADLKLFKKYTMGHPIIMGRNTHESIGKALPGRTNIVVTTNKSYQSPGTVICHSLEEAIKIAGKEGADEAFIIGGAQLFKSALTIADRFYLTRIHETFDADIFLPALDESQWYVIEEESFEPDEKNKHSFTFQILERVKEL